MKLFAIRSAAAATLLSLLTACGGTDQTAVAAVAVANAAAPTRTVMEATTTGDMAAAPTRTVMEATATGDMAAAQLPQSGEQVPTPDCQPENCQGLRIIDGNAETYRVDAMRRSAADAG